MDAKHSIGVSTHTNGCPRFYVVPYGQYSLRRGCGTAGALPRCGTQPAPTPHTAPVPPQSAAQEHPAPPFAHHYTLWPADAAQWTPPQEYQAWKTPLWYRHPSISPRLSSQWSCSHILQPHPCRGLSGLSFFQPRSTFSSWPGTCSGVLCPAR